MAGVSVDAAPTNNRVPANRAEPDPIFSFVPTELAVKCRALVETYHTTHGYTSLPDLLWRSNMRHMIKRRRELGEIYRKACKARSAKHANNSFVLIATAILTLEVLARDIGGLGTQFPNGKQEANELLRISPLKPRIWLMDTYIEASHYASLIRSLTRARGE